MYHIPDPAPTSLAAASTLTTSLRPKTHKKSKSLDPSKLRQAPIETHRFFPEQSLEVPPVSTISDTQRAMSNALFSTVVIELVRIVQAALSIFGFFQPPPGATLRSNPSIDGLLCDNTVVGVQSWIAEIGGPFIGIEVCIALLSCFLLTVAVSIADGACHGPNGCVRTSQPCSRHQEQTCLYRLCPCALSVLDQRQS